MLNSSKLCKTIKITTLCLYIKKTHHHCTIINPSNKKLDTQNLIEVYDHIFFYTEDFLFSFQWNILHGFK